MRTLSLNGGPARSLATAGRLVCASVALVLVAACGSSPHSAYTQSGDYDSGFKARAAGFVSALNSKDVQLLGGFVFPDQKKDVPAFLAAYGGRSAVLIDFAQGLDGPDTEGVADIQITCSAGQTIVVPEMFSWKNGNWRTFIYLPGQKAG
jgi:hypothetical protein